MTNIDFVEDIFFKFYHLVLANKVFLQHQDYTAAKNFFEIIRDGRQLTENQGKYLLRILEKYKNLCEVENLSYKNCLLNPIWKNNFRSIDMTKKSWLENDENGKIWVVLKFPYSLKEEFEKEFVSHKNFSHSSHWDAERKVRKVPLYSLNLISLFTFLSKNNFEIDESLISAVSTVEEIWNQASELDFHSRIVNGQIQLVNAPHDTSEYWNSHSTGVLYKDMFLAKTMGYPLKIEKISDDLFEQVCSSKEKYFWIDDLSKFFEIYKKLEVKVCVLLDRTANQKKFIEKIVNFSDQIGISRKDIKVCFRESGDNKTNFNQWIKDNSLGGKVEEGNIFIFNHKPPKWLFSEDNFIKIIVTNSVYLDSNVLNRDWLRSHPCVIYVGDSKPAISKGEKVVEL